MQTGDRLESLLPQVRGDGAAAGAGAAGLDFFVCFFFFFVLTFCCPNTNNVVSNLDTRVLVIEQKYTQRVRHVIKSYLHDKLLQLPLSLRVKLVNVKIDFSRRHH